MTKGLFLPPKPRYDILDGLRGVAALVILLYHVLEGCGVVLGHGYLGVDFFYVLSGFVIGYAYDDRWGRMSVGGFFKRRIIRLHPMVIMGTAIGLALYYFQTSDALPLIGQRPWWVVLLLFFYCCLMLPMPNAWDIRGWQDTNSFNGNIWSLYWEYLANICYAFFLRFVPTIVLAALTVVAAVATLDLTLNLNLFGLISESRVGAPYTVNGGWSLAPSELYVGAVRLGYPFLVGMMLSRTKRLVRMKGGFVWPRCWWPHCSSCPHSKASPTVCMRPSPSLSSCLSSCPSARAANSQAEVQRRLQVSGRPVLPAIHHPPASGEPANRVCIQPSRSSPVEPHHGIGSHVFPFGYRGLRLPQTVRRARAALVAAEVDAASRHPFIRT